MDINKIQEIDNDENQVYIFNILKDEIDYLEHQHRKGQMIYGEGGIIHIFTGGKHWYLPGRCYMWIPPHTPHSVISHSNHIELFNFYFKPEAEDADFYKEPNIFMVNDLLREMILYTKNWNGGINQHDSLKLCFMQAIKAILPEVSHAIAAFPVQHPYPKDQRLLEIAQFLNQNLEDHLPIEKVAKKFGFSSRTLSRLFSENLGMSYVKFLRAIRISKALELIAENKYNIYQIALMVGYNSLSSFSNIFNQVIGMRPADFIAKTNKK